MPGGRFGIGDALLEMLMPGGRLGEGAVFFTSSSLTSSSLLRRVKVMLDNPFDVGPALAPEGARLPSSLIVFSTGISFPCTFSFSFSRVSVSS